MRSLSARFMQSRTCNVINACTLFGLGTVFLSFYGTGRIEQYLNPTFRPFVMIGGILMFIMGVTCLLTLPSEHCCSEGGCEHRHASRLSVSLASFGLICVSVLAGSTFSKDAFDQQIFVNRGSMDEDSKVSGGFASNAVIPAVSKSGIARDLQLMITLRWKSPIYCAPKQLSLSGTSLPRRM